MRRFFYLIFFVITLILQPDISHADVPPPKNPNSAKACAICHFRWVDTFFIEGRGSDLVGYQSEKVAATPEMCRSCHDGSIADSRARLSGDFGHRTNVAPPADMKIPKIFPLDEDGKMQCATCHTAHGVPSGPDSEETIFMRTSNRSSAMCRMCHPGKAGSSAAGNHPLGGSKQEVPRELVVRYAKTGQDRHQVMCETCHTAHGSPDKHFLVKSAGNSSLCLACHRDKNVFTADGKKRPTHVINAKPAGAKIPDLLIKRGAKLGIDGVLTCQTCHKVHNNKIEQQLLLIAKDNKSTLCLTCHTDKQYIADTKHNLLHSAPGEKNLEGKTVAEAGICSACHLPHKAARKLSGQGDFTARLCLSCHGKGKIAEKAHLAGNTHPLDVNPFKRKSENAVLATVSVSKDKLKLPLFNRSGMQDRGGNMTCATCHDTHKPPEDSAKKVKAGKKMEGKKIRSTLFLRRPSPEICRECHRNKFSIASSKHDLKLSAPGAKNIFKQKPAESGLCGSCHLVHGSRKDYLWARQTTTRDGGGVQGLCFSCHNEEGIARKKVHRGYSHPMSVAPGKKGMKTKLPLFDNKGKISPKGLMACHTCHDPHRWQPPATAGESQKNVTADGPAATSFLRKPSPQVCQECHREKFYIANSKHDLNRSAPQEKNSLNQTPSQSGLCGTCHLVHNARKDFLWARGIDPDSGGVVQGLCNSCHREKGLAGSKVIKGQSHPLDLAPSEKGLKTSLPLFDKEGRPAADGEIRCHTCHDPHRWDPLKRLKNDHSKIEGNSRNSFLRLENSPAPRLCANCHPDQALIQKTDHDLIVSAPSSKNAINQTPLESGTCGVCHVAHNGKVRINLWARGFGDQGANLLGKMCNSCHSKNGSAKNKVPKIASHPDAKFVNLAKSPKGRPGYFPLFHEYSGKPVRAGNISCPSCHNAHQWAPQSRAKGRGINVEGDATNSFLRGRAHELPCKDCHGLDALFRFKAFHDPVKRKKQFLGVGH